MSKALYVAPFDTETDTDYRMLYGNTASGIIVERVTVSLASAGVARLMMWRVEATQDELLQGGASLRELASTNYGVYTMDGNPTNIVAPLGVHYVTFGDALEVKLDAEVHAIGGTAHYFAYKLERIDTEGALTAAVNVYYREY